MNLRNLGSEPPNTYQVLQENHYANYSSLLESSLATAAGKLI